MGLGFVVLSLTALHLLQSIREYRYSRMADAIR
jgi:hypothetical protein